MVRDLSAHVLAPLARGEIPRQAGTNIVDKILRTQKVAGKRNGRLLDTRGHQRSLARAEMQRLDWSAEQEMSAPTVTCTRRVEKVQCTLKRPWWQARHNLRKVPSNVRIKECEKHLLKHR